ncbi:MAG: hypothetical protein KDA44_22465, partial [Planctomycetales bacterium]|nr:hypothetical protein [Planctomycetales bacterium]
ALVCPDCGATTLVVAPAIRPLSGVQPPTAGDDYELDAASAPTPRPAPRGVAIIEAERHEQARARNNGGRGHKKLPSHSSREICPRVPLLQGAASMLLTGAIATRWLTLSAGLFVVMWFAMQAWTTFSSLSQMGAIMAICFYALAVMLGALWFVAASAVWLAVVAESADGHRRLHNPPTSVYLDWLGDAVYLGVAAVAAALPACGVARFIPWGPLNPLAVGAVAWAAALPVMLLSALEEASPMGVLSPRVWSSLVRRPLHWALFYAMSALIVAFAVSLVVAAPAAVNFLAPMFVAVSLVYFRLLGLLGWWLSESMADDEEDEAERS